MIEIELNGERRRVALRREGDQWSADIDGRALEVSAVEAGGRWSMLVDSGLSRISYEVAFEPGAAGELIVHVNGVAIPLTINENRRPARQRAGDPTAGRGPRMIVAPMPGRIVKVLVKPQEKVSARQPLVVVEAMKMENELRAPRGGTVTDVRVAEGSSVEANTVLVVLE